MEMTKVQKLARVLRVMVIATFAPIFLMAGLLCMVMSALFRQATELKADQNLTI